jgi:hypothetical protein
MQKFHGFVDSTQKFIDASKAIHGERYDYSLSVFIGSERKITVICRDHGEFDIRADSHYRKGCGCRKCGMDARKHRSRKYKTCECGVVGYGGRQFPFAAKGKCAECWSKITGRAIQVRVRDEWDRWANTQGSEFFRYEKKKIARHGTPWDHWLTLKSSIICTRRRAGKTNGIKQRKFGDWDDCLTVSIQRIRQQRRQQETSGWDRKSMNWMRSLRVRSRMLPGKNCGN